MSVPARAARKASELVGTPARLRRPVERVGDRHALEAQVAAEQRHEIACDQPAAFAAS